MALEPTPELTERYLEKIDIGDKGDCWEWAAGKISQGYGQLKTNSRGSELAHRYMMALHGFDIGGKQVNHHCDNRACVNPTHLYIGTQVDNVEDAVERDRFPTAEDHHATKLDEEKVRQIRDKHDHGVSMNELGRQYGVDAKTISDVVKRKTWRYVE